MKSGELPGLSNTVPKQIIFHVDMDCFYAACERVRRPKLKNEPIIVGMGYREGSDSGAVATASYEAREYGVKPAQSISTAMELLPQKESNNESSAVYLPVDMEYYESVSEQVMTILETMSGTMRIESIDEAYLDVTNQTTWTETHEYAKKLKQTIRKEVGVVASVGVGPTMGVAKIASDFDKPNGLWIVHPKEVKQFLYPLKVNKIHGVGPVTEEKLNNIGVDTIGDLAEIPLSTLISTFDEQGKELYKAARGIDTESVVPKDDPKSFSRESSVGKDTSINTLRSIVETLANDVANRAEKEGSSYQTITLKLVERPYNVNTVSESLTGPINNTDLVKEVALDLLNQSSRENIRKVGVKVSNLTFETGKQTQLGDWGEDIDPLNVETPKILGNKKNTDQSNLSDF